jgi:hypothetical protein
MFAHVQLCLQKWREKVTSKFNAAVCCSVSDSEYALKVKHSPFLSCFKDYFRVYEKANTDTEVPGGTNWCTSRQEFNPLQVKAGAPCRVHLHAEVSNVVP